MNPLIRKMGMAVLLCGMAGCHGPSADLQAWIAAQKALKPPPLPALPVLKKFEMFDYTDQAMRDPFSVSSSANSGAGAGPHPDLKRPKQPLEAFSLDSLKMVGTIGVVPAQEVLIQDPTGLIHRVRIGEYMGLNYGRIVTMTSTQVDLKELVPDGSGGWTERTSTVSLHQ
ncbi:pilus assembly protein PilP [Frateuria aurantia]